MDELKKGLDVSMKGPLREEALEQLKTQLGKWDIAMPSVEPLVSDFGLGDFYSVGLIEYWIANEIKAGYCGKYLIVFDGQTCPAHQHEQKHETFFIVKGTVRIEHGNIAHELNPGDTLSVSQGELHSFTGIGPALLLEISMPCFLDDNYFENIDIPLGSNYKRK